MFLRKCYEVKKQSPILTRVHHAIPTDSVPTDAIPTVHSRDVGWLIAVEYSLRALGSTD